MRRIDLPAALITATWGEGVVLGDGNPVRLGRMSIAMRGSGSGAAVVKTPKNALDGLIIDNLSCYNSVRGERRCALLLNAPDRCHLFVYASPLPPDGAGAATSDSASSGSSDSARSGPAETTRSRMVESEDYAVVCPSTLLLRR